MLEIGKRQLLTIVKKVDFGVYLAKEQEADPENAQPGDEIEVFLYRDSKDRMIATVRQPKLSLGEVAVLRVKENGKIGAFLDW